MLRNQTFKVFNSLILLALIFSATGVTPARAAGIFYVKPSGTGNCSNWVNACGLQTALTSAVSSDEIWVAAGTYKPTETTDRTISFTLKNGVKIYGGFAGTETLLTQRDPALNVSILSGDIGTVSVNTDNSYHVVVGSGTDNTAILDGFTITNGNASENDSSFPYNVGGGLYNYYGSPTLSNLIFTANLAGYGAGMFNYYSSPIIAKTIFDSNTASRGSGGIGNSSSTPTLNDIGISNNRGHSGAGMSNDASNSVLTNVTFIANNGYWGGGIFNINGSSPIMKNITFGNNIARDGSSGGGIVNGENSSPTLINVTFSANTATSGGAMYNYNGSTPQIYNSIFWNDGSEIYNASVAPIIKDSVIQGGCPAGSTCTNVINTDPKLGILANNGGFTQTMALGSGSSAIDAGGVNSTCATIDQRGTARPQGVRCDIGAYEAITISGSAGVNGATLSYTDGTAKTATADGSGNYSFTVSYDWSGVVTPSKAGYTFSPVSKNYSNVIASQINQDYAASTPIITSGIWTPTGSMITPRDQFNLVTLDDGRVLAAGGHNSSGWITASEIYDPATDAWTSTGSLHFPRIWFGHLVKLHDGRILITGGANPAGSVDYAATEIFDPATGQWTYSGNLNTARRGVDPVVLEDGRVLVAGGANGVPNESRYLSSSEIFNPETNTWSYTGNLNIGIDSVQMRLLADGRVVILGGNSAFYPHNPHTEMYSPNTGAWVLAGDFPAYTESFTTLSDDRILAIGGWSGNNGISNMSLFNPSTGFWATSTPMSVARIAPAVTRLPNGGVLVAGGFPSFSSITGISSAEIFNPDTGNVGFATSMSSGRYAPGFTVLNDGRSLICGGGNDSGQILTTCEAYSMPQTISGGLGLAGAGASINYTDGFPKTATADGNGNYSFTVNYDWTGTVTPSKVGYIFSPVSKDYANVIADKISENYSVAAQNSIKYAKPGGLTSGTCDTWANACELRYVLPLSISGDEIWVAAGTYKPTETTDRTISFTLKNGVKIYGGFAGTETLLTQRDPALNVSILSGDIGTVSVNTDNSYHVVVGSGTDSTAILDGLTITAGNASGGDVATGWGGGMLNVSGSPTLSNLVFNKNTAGAGGGMGNSNSTGLLMSNIVFSENNGHNGGAVHNEYSSITFSNVAFTENVAGGNGGAMDNGNSTIILTDATFTNNVNNHAPGAGNGGGILSNLSTVTLTNVVFDGNTTNGSGGGMISYTSVVSLTNVLFKGNIAVDLGGGMRNYSCTNVTLNKVTFNGNAAGGGGGMHNVWSSPTLTNVTFSDNTAAQGGGLFNDSSNPNLNNVTFNGNTATNGTGSEIYNFSNSHPLINNSVLWGTNSVMYDYPNSPFSSAVIKDSVIQGGCPSGNTCTNVINADPKLSALADNGGFTQTMALGAEGSAIDAGGVNSTCAVTDQRGVARPQGVGCDIGAYEAITVSGNAGVSGATLSYTDGIAKTATANGSGDYLFTVSSNWSGTLTPSKTGYTFSPASKNYADVLANQDAQNYTATAITYTISGNTGVAGATLSYTDGVAKTVTANGSGAYSITVSHGWSGTVTPSKANYVFTPISKEYTNLSSSQVQDYTANVDTDGDGIYDLMDGCPIDPTNTCDTSGSGAIVIGADGGEITTPDGGLNIDIPVGALPDDTVITITDGGSKFDVGIGHGNLIAALSATIGPEGTHFNEPISITFKWQDMNNDGKVDGMPDLEKNLYVYKNGKRIAGPCKSDPGCDMGANTFTVHISSLSFFVMGGLLNDTVTSIPANDGWVVESSENSNVANTKNSTGDLRVGDDAKNRQYRSLLYFDTAPISNNAVITKAAVQIKKQGGDMPSTLGNLVADIKKGFFGLAPLEFADFSALAAPINTAGKFTEEKDSITGLGTGTYVLTLSPSNFKYINLIGATQFRVRFIKDDDNDKIADYISFYSGNDPDPDNQPQLIVEYYIP